MGNCQAADAAAVVIQHPGRDGGKVDRIYSTTTTAADVMKRNPGHYVALVVLHVPGGSGVASRITKIKLLKPKDPLLLGQVYRLITSQEVSKALKARRQEKMRVCDEVIEQQQRHRRRLPPPSAAPDNQEEQSRPAADHKERKRLDKDRHRSSTGTSGGRYWRPSLQSITESSS